MLKVIIIGSVPPNSLPLVLLLKLVMGSTSKIAFIPQFEEIMF